MHFQVRNIHPPRLSHPAPTTHSPHAEWKRSTIDHYRQEEETILRLACEYQDQGQVDSNYWGYAEIPSRRCPTTLVAVWIYVIDLDLDVLRVTYRSHDAPPGPGQRDTQYYPLDNIPRVFFGFGPVHAGYNIMSAFAESDNCAKSLSEVPAPNPALLALYASFSPPPAATFSVPPGPRTSAWHKIQLLLLRHFVDYYAYSFRDACPSPTSSPFVFQQIAYAILSITSTPGLKFYRTTSLGTIDPIFRTPYWEPPNSEIYHLGDVLIVLNAHLRSGALTPSTHASIALAVERTSALPSVAVVFSVHAVVVVRISGDGRIRHTPALPLFALDDAVPPLSDAALAALADIGYASPGVLALLDLFVAHPRVTSIMGAVPTALPTELWRLVFRRADEQTQAALEACCRFSRVLAGENPRVGGGTVVAWRKEGFVWVGEREETECVVDAREAEEGEEGWEVVVWGREMVLIGIPGVGVF